MMKKLLTTAAVISLAASTPVLANNRVSVDQLRVATNDFLGTDFVPGANLDGTRTTAFVPGSYNVILTPEFGGYGTGATNIMATFSATALTHVAIASHLHTPENNPPADANVHNATLVERAVAAQGGNFTSVTGLSLTGHNFALAVDWAVRMAAQPLQFVYATRGHVAVTNNVGLAPGVHLMTVPAVHDNLTLALGVSDGNIDSVAIVHRGVAGIMDPAVQALANQIVNNQSLAIDTVSGATLTSNAVTSALNSISANNHTRVSTPSVAQLSREYITASQNAWRDAVIALSEAYREGGEFVLIGEAILNNLYAFNYGVLFSPSQSTFRNDWDSILSFFVGEYADTGNQSREGDGWGLLDHRNIQFDTGSVVVNGNQAFWNGYVTFTDRFSIETVVAKSFGYTIGHDGAIRINLQHSHVVSVGDMPIL